MRYRFQVQRLELRYPFRIARGASDYRETVRLTFSCGDWTGYGEGAPNPRYGESVESVSAALEAFCGGQASGSPVFYRSFLQQERKRLGRGGAAMAAVEGAVLDWVGKSLQLPLYRLFGIAPEAMPPTSQTIGIAEPEVMAERAREAAGFQRLKVKLGTEEDRTLVQAVRRAVSMPLQVDVNEGWKDREFAVREIEWLAGQGVDLVEQPLPAAQNDEMAWVKERSALPLIADESVSEIKDLPELLDGFDGVNVKLAKCGGPLAALDLLAAARGLGLQTMIGCMVESSCGISTAAQLAPLCDYADLDSNLMLKVDPFRGLPVRAGFIRLADAPGTGAIPRE